MKWILTPLLVFSTIGFANLDAEDQFSTPMFQSDWKSAKVENLNHFNYVALLTPGIGIGHRTRKAHFGWDANASLWSIFLFSILRANLSGLCYVGSDSPFYIGLGPTVGFTHFIDDRLDVSPFAGLEFRLGKQFRKESGRNVFFQAELGAYPVTRKRHHRRRWEVQYLPTISLGTSF